MTGESDQDRSKNRNFRRYKEDTLEEVKHSALFGADEGVLLPEYRKTIVEKREEFDDKQDELKKSIKKGKSKGKQREIEADLDQIRNDVIELRELLDNDLADPQVLNIEIKDELDANDKLELYASMKVEKLTGVEQKKDKKALEEVEVTEKTFKNLPSNYKENKVVPDDLSDINTMATRENTDPGNLVVYNYDDRTGIATYSTKLGGKVDGTELEQLMRMEVDFSDTDSVNVRFNFRNPSITKSKEKSVGEKLDTVDDVLSDLNYKDNSNISNVRKFMSVMEQVLKQKYQNDFDRRTLSKNRDKFETALNEMSKNNKYDFDVGVMTFIRDDDDLEVSLETGTTTPLKFTLDEAFLDRRRV